MANKDIVRRSRVLARRLREQGIINTLRWLSGKILSKTFNALPLGKVDVLRRFDFVALKPAAARTTLIDLPRNTINWFIPPFGRGSGGHLNIFRFISNLEKEGLDCNIIVVANDEPLEDEETLRANINSWFVSLKARVYRGLDGAPPAHITLATEWRTAYYVRAFSQTNHKCYFVQDFEPLFFPVGTEYCLAEETYRFGFTGITAGGWLEQKLAKDYGMKTHSVGFSYDRDLYKPLEKPRDTNAPKRVFFYARPPTPRRAFELGMMALREVAKRTPNLEVVFAGWDLSAFEVPFVHRDLGVLAVDALPEVYSTCDVALVLSLTNLSLLPLELMACGVPIVSNDGPNNEWLLNKGNSKLTKPTPVGLADAICEVLSDTSERQRLVKAGLETAQATSWMAEAEKMANFFKSLAQR
jgi:glycosyltransferase involved in cell wall biosynthesis